MAEGSDRFGSGEDSLSNMSRTQLYYVNKLNQKNVFYLLDDEVEMMRKDKQRFQNELRKLKEES